MSFFLVIGKYLFLHVYGIVARAYGYCAKSPRFLKHCVSWCFLMPATSPTDRQWMPRVMLEVKWSNEKNWPPLFSMLLLKMVHFQEACPQHWL